jgi:hypothetical protein
LAVFRQIKDLILAEKDFQKNGIIFSFSRGIRQEQLESGFH